VWPERWVAVWEGAVGWKVWALVLYLQGVSLAVIGGWLGVHKSTVCRWLTDVATWGETWVQQQRVACSGRMAVDEKWVLIGHVWWYLFVAVDCVTGYPLHLALYPSNSGAYCRLFLLEVKRLGYRPLVVITDGWDADAQALAAVFPQAEHLLCRFHVVRALYRRLRQARVRDGRIWRRVGRLFRTRDKRTVRRRVATLQGLLEAVGAGAVGDRLQTKLPQVIGAVGSTWRPSTANAAEGVFRVFDRFYRLKGPFCDVDSALKHIHLFRLGVLLQIGANGQACPLERAGVDVATLPLYHLLNRPNVVRLRERMATQYQQAA
jgi:transposase-like protein